MAPAATSAASSGAFNLRKQLSAMINTFQMTAVALSAFS
jgi:hypothetical protein